MRRGSLTVEHLQRFLPQGLSKRLTQSRDVLSQSRSDVTDVDDGIHAGFRTNSSWNSVQNAIMSLFNGEIISILERTLLCQNMRSLSKTEIGPFIFEYYKTRLLARGLNVLLENIQREGSTLDSLIETWNEFYKETLPFLQTVFLPVAIEVTDRNFRDTTLLGFRDHVVLELPMENMIALVHHKQEEKVNALKQICLILQHVSIKEDEIDEKMVAMEKITARVVNPYLGNLGLYKGSPEPVIRSSRRISDKSNKKISTHRSEDQFLSAPPPHHGGRKSNSALTSSLTCLQPAHANGLQSTYDPHRRRHSVHFDISVV